MPADEQSSAMRGVLRNPEVFAGELCPSPVRRGPDTPRELFAAWLTEAVTAGVCEPHAVMPPAAGQGSRKGRPTQAGLPALQGEEHVKRSAGSTR